MTEKRPFSAAHTHQTDTEIETVLRQLAPASESPAPTPEPRAPTPQSHAPTPEPHAPRKAVNWARFGPSLRVLAVGAFVAIGGRCAYLEYKLSGVTIEVAASEAQAHACERRMQRRIPSDAAEERDVRPDLNDASRRIQGVGPIHQTAPGVFTNRDPDPAEMSPR